TVNKFHDGTDYNAQAQKFSMDRIRTNKASIGYGDCGDNIVLTTEAVDDYTFRLTLADPYTPFLTKLTGRCGAAVSPTAVQKMGDDEFGLHPVGTGPFKFLEFKKDDHFSVAKFDNYWRMGADGKPLPYLDKIVWRVITDSNGRLQAALNGELDEVKDVADKDIETVKSSPELVYAQYPGLGWNGFVVNVSKPPFNNKALAQAVAYATDRDEYIRVIQKNLVDRADFGTIPPTLSWAIDKSYIPYTYDPAKAKAKLAEGGFPNGGFSFTLLADTSDPVAQQSVELLQAQYKKVGIDMKIEAGPFNDVVLPRAKKGDFEAARSTVVGGVDPDTWIYQTFHTDGNLNRAHFSDPAVDKLAEQGRSELDPAKRAQIYQQAEKLIMDRSPWIMISYSTYRFTGRKVVQNYYAGFKATPGYGEIWKTAD
ncbi:MAG: ABC transporter substrate-binding protein, partial [Dehalococcoidia bacterium]